MWNNAGTVQYLKKIATNYLFDDWQSHSNAFAHEYRFCSFIDIYYSLTAERFMSNNSLYLSVYAETNKELSFFVQLLW